MKKLFSLLLSIIIIIVLTSCSDITAPLTNSDLTEEDYSYIDLVYDNIEIWDGSYFDSGKDFYVTKIMFCDFDNSGKLSFFVSYPIAGGRTVGYYINNGELENISNSSDSEYWGMITTLGGTDWDTSMSGDDKYSTIEQAYLKYLEKMRNSN